MRNQPPPGEVGGVRCRRHFYWVRWTGQKTLKQIHTPIVVQRGGGGRWNPPLKFLICCSILKRFYLLWKASDLLYKMRYILWVVALLGACDVTNNGRHLGLYQELEIRFKPREVMIFCAWHGEYHSESSQKPYGRGVDATTLLVRLRVKTM